MRCHNCGCSIPTDSTFCQYCGSKLAFEQEKEPAAAPQPTISAATSVSAAAASPEPEETKKVSILLRAYKSYLSQDPEERLFFEGVRRSAALKDAYLQECRRSRQEAQNGSHPRYKQSYLDFLQILHDDFFGEVTETIAYARHPAETYAPAAPRTTQAAAPRQSGRKHRYCGKCGQQINRATRRCIGCGKRYFNPRFILLYLLIAALVAVGVYAGGNYFFAVRAMNRQKFSESKQFFDQLVVSREVFPEDYAYVEAGILMEKGRYLDALRAFEELPGSTVPAAVRNELMSRIYSLGQEFYRSDAYAEAETYFRALGDYGRCEDYLFLIGCHMHPDAASGQYEELYALIGFEDADKIILLDEVLLEQYLFGLWKDDHLYPYTLEMYEADDGAYRCRYDLPAPDLSAQYFYLTNGAYSVGKTEASIKKVFKFSIVDKDTMDVYCYEDQNTYTMHRQ